MGGNLAWLRVWELHSSMRDYQSVMWGLRRCCSDCVQDILSRFNGSWALRPIKSEDGAAVVGTDAVLEQDILPAGQRPFQPACMLNAAVLVSIWQSTYPHACDLCPCRGLCWGELTLAVA